MIPEAAVEAALYALGFSAQNIEERRQAMRAALEAAAQHMMAGVTALADSWESRGEYDMAYSKTMADEEAAIQILANGAQLVDDARLIRNALNNEGTTMPGQPETLLEDTDPNTVFTISLSVEDAVDAIEDHLRNDSVEDLNSTAFNIWGLLIDASHALREIK